MSSVTLWLVPVLLKKGRAGHELVRFLGTYTPPSFVPVRDACRSDRYCGSWREAEQVKRRSRRVIFIWLAGGSSQFETWDPKPGRETGGPFRSISTSVPGYRICELMPKLEPG